MIELKNVSKAYDHPVLHELSYVFPERGAVALKGPSGSGKTTLLRLLAGLEKPDAGEIAGTEGKRISVAFQEARLLPFLSLSDNILLVRDKGNTDRDRAMELLRFFRLEHAAQQKPDTLSGGEKCRAALARSLYFGGDIFLWDEPTRELDPDNRILVQKAIAEWKSKALIIVSTHDPDLRFDNTLTL